MKRGLYLALTFLSIGGMLGWASGEYAPRVLNDNPLGQLDASSSRLAQTAVTRLHVHGSPKTGGKPMVEIGFNGVGGESGFVNERGANVVNLGVMPMTNAVFDAGDGVLIVSNLAGNPRLFSHVSKSDAGRFTVLDPDGSPTAYVDGLQGFHTVRAGLAEGFQAAEERVPAGTVMVLDPDRPEILRPSSIPYDRRVVGVVAGHEDEGPGITLRDDLPHKRLPVALAGTVHCRVTSENGPIDVGDLLTTSSVPGHAMRAADPQAAQGAILGKAMERFDDERGIIRILANLQ